MVNPVTDAKGIGTKMVEHALDEARLLKYKAMQFNFVVSTNERAIALWKRHGFSIIGIRLRHTTTLSMGLWTYLSCTVFCRR